MFHSRILGIISLFIISSTTFAQKVILDTCICKQKILADSLFLHQKYSRALPIYSKLIKEVKLNALKQEFFLRKGHCELAGGNFKKGYRDLALAFRIPIYISENYHVDTDSSLQKYVRIERKIQKIKALYERNKKSLLGTNTRLKNEILELKEEDQKYRTTPTELENLAKNLHISLDSLMAIQQSIDFQNQKKVLLFLNETNNTWLDIASVGTDGLGVLWLIIQHTDNDLLFQEKCLDAMKKGLIEESGIWLHYAYLFDRVAVNQNKEQAFSTQFEEFIKDVNGKYIDIIFKRNDKNADVFRQCIGLPSVKEYKEMVLRRWNK